MGNECQNFTLLRLLSCIALFAIQSLSLRTSSTATDKAAQMSLKFSWRGWRSVPVPQAVSRVPDRRCWWHQPLPRGRRRGNWTLTRAGGRKGAALARLIEYLYRYSAAVLTVPLAADNSSDKSTGETFLRLWSECVKYNHPTLSS